jgi:cytochrome c oxidase assembly factor CtaG
MRLTIAALIGTFPGPAAAHGAGGGDVDAWLLWGGALVLASWHVIGARRQWQARTAAIRIAAFCTGLVFIAAVLIGPMAEWAERTFTGHMTQHLILLVVAPPLLLLGRPLTALLRALPHRLRFPAARMTGSRFRSLAINPIAAALLQAAVVSAWHVPALFAAAASDPLLHELEHASLIAVALLYWHGQVEPRGAGVAAMVGGLVATIWCSLLGAILTLATAPLYGTTLADQQLAGLLMWIPCGFAYLAGALAAFAHWAFGARQRWAS